MKNVKNVKLTKWFKKKIERSWKHYKLEGLGWSLGTRNDQNMFVRLFVWHSLGSVANLPNGDSQHYQNHTPNRGSRTFLRAHHTKDECREEEAADQGGSIQHGISSLSIFIGQHWGSIKDWGGHGCVVDRNLGFEFKSSRVIEPGIVKSSKIGTVNRMQIQG